MQFLLPDNSNPKRREHVVTNFSLSQKGYDFACVFQIVMLCLRYIKRFGTVSCIIIKGHHMPYINRTHP